MNRFELAHSAWIRICQTGGAGLSPSQSAKLNAMRNPQAMSGLELYWAASLATAILGAYHVPDGQLHRLSELVHIDGEGYLYFDGIRGDNVSNGKEPLVVWDKAVMAKAQDFEHRCMTALLSGRTVQQRDQPIEEMPA